MKKLALTIITTMFAFSAQAGDLSATCKSYFDQIDSFVKSSPQAEAMKPQYDASKTQIAALPVAQQDIMCQQGLDALKQVQAAMGK
ncbi:DUF5339 domain-containing protein [Caviibacterium pharyngocola]|nr:DUF5339 domain-containing protein [Caviibacterium pharyngocola]